MKKILSLVTVMLVSTSVQMIISLPWWSFTVPVFLLGVALPLEKWKVSSFLLGFAAGFLVWLLSTFYFETIYKGEILNAVNKMITEAIPKGKILNAVSKMITVRYFFLYIIIGLIGGVLSGLALYSGFLLRRGRERLRLDLPES